MKIAALDFETANRYGGSICAVGIAIYADGIETEGFSSLVRPHAALYAGPWEFQYIHGIARHDVAQSPELPSLLSDMAALMTSADIVVCHNAAFDINQLRAALKLYDLPFPDFNYLCSCVTGRRVCRELPNHKLNTMAGHFDFPFRHHDALDDARAAAHIMCRMMGGSTLAEFVERHRLKVHPFNLPNGR